MTSIVSIQRYPVKSMAGETLDEVKMWWHGFEGDRRFAFVRSDNLSHFPWLTAREVPQLLLYRPMLIDPSNAPKSPVMVTTPDQQKYAVTDPELRQELADRANEPVHLMHLGRGAYDSTAGISIISTTTIQTLSELAGCALEPARFRANLVVETTEDELFPEQQWIGKTLILGDHARAPRVRVIRPIPRCMIINLDPTTAQQNPAVLRTVVECNRQWAGVYAVPESVGTLEKGGQIRVAH